MTTIMCDEWNVCIIIIIIAKQQATINKTKKKSWKPLKSNCSYGCCCFYLLNACVVYRQLFVFFCLVFFLIRVGEKCFYFGSSSLYKVSALTTKPIEREREKEKRAKRNICIKLSDIILKILILNFFFVSFSIFVWKFQCFLKNFKFALKTSGNRQ